MDQISLRAKPVRDRHGERGAALITALLFSLMLLIAGGAVLMTTALANTTAIDSTAEMQAYYAAEAGLQSGLNVLRGNDAPAVAGTLATFRAAVLNPNLNQWITYGANGRVTLSGTSAYDLTVTDPDDPTGATLAANANYQPDRLIVRATGYGPKGSIKRLELMISRRAFSYTPSSTVTLRGSDVASEGMPTFAVGNSQPHTYSGIDNASPAQPSLPAFGVTNSTDYGNGTTTGIATLQVNADSSNILGSQQLAQLNPASLSTLLQSANNARYVLNLLEDLAVLNNNYYNTDPTAGTVTTPAIGTAANPQFTYVNGDLTLNGSGGRGGGLLVVTGKLTMTGSSRWDGLILVLGEGEMERDGTPDTYGSIVVAKFDRNGTGGFQAPTFNSNGGGNSTIQYDSNAINNALNTLGSRVVGVREY